MKQTRLTTLKAPMAHKTFSQEQFQFRFYTFSISFNLQNNEKVNNINTLNKSLFIALLVRNNFINFSTNMLFLKLHEYHSYLKPFVEYLNYMPQVLQYDENIINKDSIIGDIFIEEKLKEI